MRNDHFRFRKKPRIVGTGFVALDLIINGQPIPRIEMGGSCGNVMAILSHMGWHSYPIVHLSIDQAGIFLFDRMAFYGLNTVFSTFDDAGRTPIVVEKLSRIDNKPLHEFAFDCPLCGSKYPRRKRLTLELAEDVIQDISFIPEVFYFDRVSSATIRLAKYFEQRGSIIYFEPMSNRTGKLYREALDCSHIVKYSSDQIPNLDYVKSAGPLLEIKTLGDRGLEYRYSNNNAFFESNWRFLPSYPISYVKDTTGSGDWLSAGLIHLLANRGSDDFELLTERELIWNLMTAQSLSAINCQYEGALGASEILSLSRISKSVMRVMNHQDIQPAKQPNPSAENIHIMKSLCTTCRSLDYEKSQILNA